MERPERLGPKILKWLPLGAVFVSQLARGVELLPVGIAEEALPTLVSAPWRRGTVRVFRRTS